MAVVSRRIDRSRPPTQLVLSGDRRAPDAEEANLLRFVRRRMLEEIEGSFSPHLRLPPIRQIADVFGVSVGTANQAIKDLVSMGVLVSRPRRGTVLAAGCTLQHVTQMRQQAERQPAPSHAVGRRIQIMLAPHSEDMIVEMAESFARAIARHGCSAQFDEYPPLRMEWSEAAVGDATVMFQPQCDPNQAVHWDARQPLLVVGTWPVSVDRSEGFDQLAVDDEQGGYLAGRLARDGGWSRVCFVGRRAKQGGGKGYDATSDRRLAGFERGFGAAVPASQRLIIGSYDIDQGAAVVSQFVKLSPRPQVVFCGSDDAAIGFMLGAKAHGLETLRDLQLIGFDKQQRALDVPGGPVTTIEVPRVALGERAAELILSRLADPAQPVRRVFLGCTLFNGQTFRATSPATSTGGSS
jgi:DNA-binding LacI/PurR family transcriptional regulator